jgi:hypothetical protein
VAIIVGAAVGAGSELLIQAVSNKLSGRDWTDPDCYEWGEVAFAGGMGAIGGNWVKGWVTLAKGSMKWNNVSRRIRRAEDLVRKPEDLHHWAVPRKWFEGNPGLERIFNRPWNLRPMNRRLHQELHRSPYWRQIWGGAPPQIRGAAGLGVVGAAGEMADGGWE